MKLLTFVAAAILAVVLIWVGAAHVLGERHALVGDVEWPGGGTLHDFPRQFPNVGENESATRLLATAARMPESELRDMRIAKDLSGVSGDKQAMAFLTKHASTIATLRAEIISNPPPVWTRQVDDILDPPTPPLMLHMRLFAVFASDALAHRHDTAVAWSDLHAAWILARVLWQRPEMMSATVALSGTRIIVAVASKLPQPRPPWWNEVARFDVRRPFVRALEYEAWAAHQRAQRYPAGEPEDTRWIERARRAVAPLLRPVRTLQANAAAARSRELAAALINHTPSPALQRIQRFEAERALAGR